jgi:hypothetical protein
METIRINIKHEQIPLLQRKKSNSALCSIYHSSLQDTPFWVLLCVWREPVSGLNALYTLTTGVRSVLTAPENTPHSDVELSPWRKTVVPVRCCSYHLNVINQIVVNPNLRDASPRHRHGGLYTILRSTQRENCRRGCLPLLQHLHWLYVKRIQLVHTHSTPCCSLRKSSCCRRNVTSASWWVIMHDIQHILLILHTASSRTRKCMRHDSACFSQITMHPFKYISSAR